MPQMSPTTSLHTLETRPAFRRSIRDSLAPFSLWEAMAWNGRGSAAVTATPMMSNTMPRPMNSASIKRAAARPAPSSIASDARLSTADRTTAIKKTVRAQRYGEGAAFPFCCFFKRTSVRAVRRTDALRFVDDDAKPAAAKKVNLTA